MAGKTVDEIFGQRLNNAKVFEASTLASMTLLNDGKGHFVSSLLTPPLQWSPLFSFASFDYNHDGKPDLLTGGNFYGTQPYEGRYDAMPLALATGDGKGNFTPVFPLEQTIRNINGEVRDIKAIKLANNKTAFIIVINNSSLLVMLIKG
jgi:hypothetical protein